MKLENDRVTLIPYGSEHIPFFQKWRRYYGNNFFTTLYPSLDALEEGFESYLKKSMEGHVAWWVICDPEKNDPIGMIGLNDIDPKNGTAEIGQMFMVEQHRGQGYMSTAIELVLELAFCHLRLNTIYLWTWDENENAIKSYIKAGFVKTGYIPEAIYRNQHYYSKIVMSMIKAGWHARTGHA